MSTRVLFCLAILSAACGSKPPTPASKIEHLVVVIQENHTFDNHFGRYCTAAPGSNPSCTSGPSCCEAAPAKEPSGASPIDLDDAAMGTYDPNHESGCEAGEINNGAMDHFVTGTACSDPRNFAVSNASLVAPYWAMAGQGALADRYFQPVIGQSSSNDMYFARAGYVFRDNDIAPDATGQVCGLPAMTMDYTDATIGDLLDAAHASWTYYGEGYQTMVDALARKDCPEPDAACGAKLGFYPCVYTPTDNPFAYYPSLRKDPAHLRDLAVFGADLSAGTLPQVSFVKAIGFRTEHPGLNTKLSDGVAFVKNLTDQIAASPYAASTLVLVAYDEGGGYFDHVAPPASPDEHPYGTRVPLIALGPFARTNAISHTQLEHSSIVRFIEWNWLGAEGQLGQRDRVVANLGSLLDATRTGIAVPE